jgi:hypothetical protein
VVPPSEPLPFQNLSHSLCKKEVHGRRKENHVALPTLSWAVLAEH